MRERLRGTGPRTTVARAACLLHRSARACPSHAFRLKQDGQDGQDGQDEGEKVWKTLMSIERRRNKEKRSVRTLISIDLPTKKKRASVPVARGPVPRMRRRSRCV